MPIKMFIVVATFFSFWVFYFSMLLIYFIMCQKLRLKTSENRILSSIFSIHFWQHIIFAVSYDIATTVKKLWRNSFVSNGKEPKTHIKTTDNDKKDSARAEKSRIGVCTKS